MREAHEAVVGGEAMQGKCSNTNKNDGQCQGRVLEHTPSAFQ